MNGFMVPFFFPLSLCFRAAGLEKAKNLAGAVLRLIQDWLSDAEFGKNLASLSIQIAASANRPFKFQKRGQLFIGTHNETLAVPVSVSNDDSLRSTN
jgi:hypothetical protein